MKKISHLCLRLGQIKAASNRGIDPMCLRQWRRKLLREVWDIFPMEQWELSHICLRLGRSKAVRINGGISPMCLRQWRSKEFREGWDIAPMGQ